MKLTNFNSYDDYKRIQSEVHFSKIHLLWFCGLTASPLRLASTLLLGIKSPSIVCLGSRNGLEPRFFKESGFSRSTGLDIASTANIFPFMMNHDFHEPRPVYVKPFDVAYSNSFDHSYDLDRFLLSCRSFLNNDSLMIFDYSPSDNVTKTQKSEADCLSVGIDELIESVYNSTGFRLVIREKADPWLSRAWPHYKDLEHLIFASPRIATKASNLVDSIDKDFFKVCNGDQTIHEYLQVLASYTAEHMAYVDTNAAIL